MSTRLKTLIIAILPVISAIAAASVEYKSSSVISEAAIIHGQGTRLARHFSDLSMLAHEQLIRLDQRGVEQWQATYEKAAKQLKEITGAISDKDESLAIEQIAKGHRNIGYLFEQQRRQPANVRFTARTTSRIVQELQSAESSLDNLQSKKLAQMHKYWRINRITSLSLLLLMAIAIPFSALLAARSASKESEQLLAAMNALAKGELAYRMKAGALGMLSRVATAFNRMSEARQRSETQLRESENELRETIANLPVMVVTIDVNGAVTSCNGDLLKTVDRKQSEVLGKNWFDLFMPDDKEAKQAFSRMVKNGELVEKNRGIIKDRGDNSILIDWSHSLLRDTNGAIAGTRSVGINITAQVASEDALRKSRRTFISLADSNPESLCLIDRSGKVLATNITFANRLNRRVKELVGCNYYSLFDKDQGDEHRRRISQAFEAGVATSFIDNNNLWHLENRLQPVKDNNGNVESLAILSIDISSQKQAEMDILSRNKELEQGRDDAERKIQELLNSNSSLERIKKELETKLEKQGQELAELGKRVEEANKTIHTDISADFDPLPWISRSIDGPVNSIGWLSHLARLSDRGHELNRYLEELGCSAEQFMESIAIVSDRSMMESGSFAIERVDFSLGELLESIKEKFAHFTGCFGTKISTLTVQGMPDGLSGDRDRIEHIISIFIKSILSANNPEAVSITVSKERDIASDPHQIEIRFSIDGDSNNGNISEPTESIFLHFAKNLAEKMGGKVSPTEKAGNITFTIVAGVWSRTPRSAARASYTSAISQYKRLEGARILVVDDSSNRTKLTKNLLESANMNVEEAIGCRKALDMVSSHGQDLDAIMITKIEMKEMDAFEITRNIRNVFSRDQLPVIGISSSTSIEERRISSEAGMNMLLSSPILPERLYEAILRLVPARKGDETKGADVDPDSSDEMDMPDNLPGISMENALKRVNNNRSLLARLIKLFAKENQSMSKEIGQMINEGDTTAAARILHGLKGVAGNIGAEKLHGACDQLEHSLRRKNRDGIREAYIQFEKALTEVRNSARLISRSKEIGEKRDDEILSPLDPLVVLGRLRNLLSSRSLPSSEILGQLRLGLTDSKESSIVNSIVEAVYRLDYSHALLMLDKLAETRTIKPEKRH